MKSRCRNFPAAADSHKGNFGHALLIGGSAGLAGSISLSALAALRTGAGLVTVATPQSSQAIVAGYEPSYMTLPLPDADGRVAWSASHTITPVLPKASVVACGPGLGRSGDVTKLIAWLYTVARQTAGRRCRWIERPGPAARHSDRATGPAHPHSASGGVCPAGPDRHVAEGERESLAKALANRTGAVVLLKGHRTVITDGQRVAINTTGNPGMATGGSGDVLTGIITALVCQHLSPFDAAYLGAHVHGLAGDLAAQAVGPVGLMASDLVRFVPAALAKCLAVVRRYAGGVRIRATDRAAVPLARARCRWSGNRRRTILPSRCSNSCRTFFRTVRPGGVHPDIQIGILGGLDANLGRSSVMGDLQVLDLLGVAAVQAPRHAQDGRQLPDPWSDRGRPAGENWRACASDPLRDGSGRRWRSVPTRAAEKPARRLLRIKW